MDNEISAVMTATMSKIKEMVDTNTVVGEPITTPDDITLIPLSRVSFAFASGGSEFPMKENKNGVGCGSGAGVKVEPSVLGSVCQRNRGWIDAGMHQGSFYPGGAGIYRVSDAGCL